MVTYVTTVAPHCTSVNFSSRAVAILLLQHTCISLCTIPMECYLYHMHMDLVLPPGKREVGGVWKEVGRGVWREVWEGSVEGRYGRGVWREVWEGSVEGRYGSGVWKGVGRGVWREVWEGSVEGRYGRGVWKGGVGGECGREVWEGSVEGRYGRGVWKGVGRESGKVGTTTVLHKLVSLPPTWWVVTCSHILPHVPSHSVT